MPTPIVGYGGDFLFGTASDNTETDVFQVFGAANQIYTTGGGNLTVTGGTLAPYGQDTGTTIDLGDSTAKTTDTISLHGSGNTIEGNDSSYFGNPVVSLTKAKVSVTVAGSGGGNNYVGIDNYKGTNKITLTGGGNTIDVNDDATTTALVAGTAGGNTVYAGLFLDGHAGNTYSVQFVGSSNSILGGDANFTITGGVNNNYVNIGLGNNTVTLSGTGNQILVSSGNDVINAGSGSDSVQLFDYAQTTTPGVDNVQIAGTGDSVTEINSGGSDNQSVNVNGGSGTATVALGNGTDNISLGGNQNSVSLGNGKDVVNFKGNNNTLSAGNGSDTVSLAGGNGNSVTLGNGNDKVTGTGSGTMLSAGNGNDTVSLGSSSTVTLGNGNDSVSVGAGSSVTAGNGNNTFTLGGNGDTLTTGNGSNTISASGTGDTISINPGGLPDTGTNTVTLGSGNTLTANGGIDGVTAQHGDTITLTGSLMNSAVNLVSTGNMLFLDGNASGAVSFGLSGGNDTITVNADGMGHDTGTVSLANFGSGDVLDLEGLGYTHFGGGSGGFMPTANATHTGYSVLLPGGGHLTFQGAVAFNASEFHFS